MSSQKIIPELYCSDFAGSLRFYTDILGFDVSYSRPEERFAMLSFEGAELMLDQAVSVDRRFAAGDLAYPFGRGMNLQIEIRDVDALYDRARAAGCRIFLPLEVRWYRQNDEDLGVRQFIVMDPDGYLLRFAQDIGARPARERSAPPMGDGL